MRKFLPIVYFLGTVVCIAVVLLALTSCVNNGSAGDAETQYPRFVNAQKLKNDPNCVIFQVALSEGTRADNGRSFVVCDKYFVVDRKFGH